MKEQVTYVREHHPMEKEFIVETRPTGRERELTEGRTSEVSLSFNWKLFIFDALASAITALCRPACNKC